VSPAISQCQSRPLAASQRDVRTAGRCDEPRPATDDPGQSGTADGGQEEHEADETSSLSVST
jgi:hypothetical protein